MDVAYTSSAEEGIKQGVWGSVVQLKKCGCDNFTDLTHYRIHLFCEQVKMDDNATSYAGSARKSSRPFPHGPYFDTITGLFHYGRRIY